jgi:hypothetical protein
MKESQFEFLIILLGAFGTLIFIELWSIGRRLHKIYEAIGTWGVSIESKLSRLQ